VARLPALLVRYAIVTAHPSRLIVNALLLATAGFSCHGHDKRPPNDPNYAEYVCPDPIGKIIREDCSKIPIDYDGQRFAGSVGVKGIGATAEYERTAIREADSLIQLLKEQRVSLCNSFNTCKLTVAEFREEQARVDGSFVALLALKDHMATIGAEDAMRILEEIRAIRTSVVVPGAPGETARPVPVSTTGTADVDAASAAIPEGLLEAWRPGKYMKQAVDLVANGAARITAGTEYGFDGDAACVLGAFLGKGQAITMTRQFVKGRKYAFLGGGSDGATDVDLHVVRASGEVIAADTETDATPVVQFTSDTDDPLMLRLSLADATRDGEFVAVAVMSNEGYSVPAANLTKSFGSVLETAARASELVQQRGANGLVFHAGGDWAFFGTILNQGEGTSISGLDLAADTNVVLAGHDGQAQDIDIAVDDTTEGDRRVATDAEDDDQPIVSVEPVSGHVYRARLVNAKSSGPSLITMLVLATG
jgi:hypothetical protein